MWLTEEQLSELFQNGEVEDVVAFLNEYVAEGGEKKDPVFTELAKMSPQRL